MAKPLNILIIALTALGLAIQAHPQQASAQEIVLKNLVLDNVGGKIQLRFGIEVEEMDFLKDYLNEGTSLRLKCQARLQRKKILWKDATVLNKSLVFDLRNNPLTRQYSLHNLTVERTIHSKDLSNLIKTGWGRLVMDLGNWAALPRGHEYALELSVRLMHADIPGWLKTALFFWSWNVANVQQYRLNFSY